MKNIMRSTVSDEVVAIMRHVADQVLMPRFRLLKKAEIEEKAPGELVTISDRLAEDIMTPLLAALLPGSRVLGEEAASETPGIVSNLDCGDVWLIDPLDGTANYVSGGADFAVMVALLRDGLTIASWILTPINGSVAIAHLGEGAFVDGIRVFASSDAIPASSCRGAVLTRFLPEAIAHQITTNSARCNQILPGTKCAGVDYPHMVRGTQQFILFWRLLPWDHAPGALFLTEAGGFIAHLDGAPYRPSDQREGLLAAVNRSVWEAVHIALLSSVA